MNGATLTIEPGVEVELGNWRLQAGPAPTGTIVANGVLFSGTGPSADVYLAAGSGQQITGCVFDGAALALNGNASGTISDNQIDAYNSAKGIAVIGGTWTITGGTVQGASVYGVYAGNGGNVDLWRVSLVGSPKGLYASGSASVTAWLCSFVGQSSYGVENAGAGAADARWCWWGDPSGPSGVGPGSGTAVSANVLYDPWLSYDLLAPANQCRQGQNIPIVKVNLERLWVWDDGAGQFVDPGGAFTLNRNWPTYLLTHGWDGDLDAKMSMSSIGCAIRLARPDSNILAWDWADAANPDCDPNTADRVTAALIRMFLGNPFVGAIVARDVWRDAFCSGLAARREGYILGTALADFIAQHGPLGTELHFVGHSHGGGLLGWTASVMSALGRRADSLTTLDTPKLGDLIDSVRLIDPSSVDRAVVLYYPLWPKGGFGGPSTLPATNVELNDDYARFLAHTWIDGPDDGSCPTSEGWFPPGVWDPSSGQPRSVFFAGIPHFLLDPRSFPQGNFVESNLYEFEAVPWPNDGPGGGLLAALQLVLDEPFDSAASWSGTHSILVLGADPGDPNNATVLIQELGDASFFKDIDWPERSLVLTFDYMFLDPRGNESLTVYVNARSCTTTTPTRRWRWVS